MQLVDEAALRVYPRTPRSYDGCDIRVQAPADASLIVELSPTERTTGIATPASPIEIPLTRLIKEFVQSPLDERNHQLFVQRPLATACT